MRDYPLDSKFVKKLDRDVMEFIHGDPEGQNEERFNELALREFALQYNSSKPYRDYCKRKNLSPETVNRWDEIPAVSSFAFKRILSDSFPVDEAEELYYRSGVVELEHKRGPIFPNKNTVTLTAAINSLLAKTFLFPDVERIKMLLMVPSPVMAPGMVMASGLKCLMQRFGIPDSRFLISFRGLELKALVRDLRHAERSQQPLTLIGATLVIDYFLDACKKEGIRFDLPEGSRIGDSGGYMGRYAKCTKEEFFRKCKEILGVEEDFCINALWICESSTVYFDNVLKNSFSGLTKERSKEIPRWAKVVAVDPRDFKRLPKGKVGLLRLYDLANRAMSFSVLTDKMGFETENGFEVIGKWDKNFGMADIDYSPPHPGGRAATKVMDFFMRRKLSGIGKIYSRLQ